jgi:hydrogenase maturation protease
MHDRAQDETVVIGVGSPLMGDDGVGVAALEALREEWDFEPHVEMLDGGTWGMNLLPFIESAKRVVLIDAIDVGADPGSLIVLERDELPRFLSTKISPHQIDLREVLALAELRGTLPDDTVAIGLQPSRVEMSAELSPVVTCALPGLLQRVVERIESWGHESREVASDA